MSRPGRKAEIAAARQQGRDDRDAGLSRNRYKAFLSADEVHRRDGWDERNAELARRQQNEREIIVTDAISEVDDRETQDALHAIWDYVREKLPS